MPVAPSRVDLLLQYALLVAGEQDEFLDRQLGPIHLIKYVYLADLFHANETTALPLPEQNGNFTNSVRGPNRFTRVLSLHSALSTRRDGLLRATMKRSRIGFVGL